MSEIRWGDQGFAQDLIDLGIEYDYVESKGRRVKFAIMPNFENRELGLAYLLGFYDGDGSKGFNSQDKSIYPTVSSENREFLYQLKNYFGIKSEVKKATVERYDHRRDIIVRSTQYRLYLEIPLFKEMMENYANSLERKRESLERLEHYGISSTRQFLRQVLKRDLLEAMLEIISPNKIGKILGVKGETIARFAKDEYGLSIPKTAGEYQSIQYSLRNLKVNSKYYDDYFHYTNFLDGLRRGSLGLFGDFHFILKEEYRDKALIEKIMNEIVIPRESKIKNKNEPTIIIGAAWSRGSEKLKTPIPSKEIWLTQRDFEHIIIGQKAKPYRFGIFDINLDPISIGNFIYKAITKFEMVDWEEGRHPGALIYVYKIRRSGDTNYLHVLIDPDGHIVTAYSTPTWTIKNN